MLSTEIAQYLAAQGEGTFDETGVTGDIFICTLPSTPDQCIAIYPQGGPPADGKLGYDSPGCQIVVRSTTDPRPGLERAMRIYNLLHGFHHGRFIAGGTWVVSCLGVQSGPVPIGQDGNNRHEFSLNFNLEVENTAR